ncbi:fumarylacetoacetate hydrolase family protein [uncultured Thiodictyon sp.]|uniref:fumarylacetoacetate hydrolase family protein n=1 Tax=uncultured Thiodictyon sp. TaxID=1846217 RepID=UPI0025CE5FC3|nr:fumarylacetoacetate hydrolase family protein [uncultured Thiodictyon sp.]
MTYVFPPPEPNCLTVADSGLFFPIRRIFCIGRNYEEHALEMGAVPQRAMPFFFQKSPTFVVAQNHSGDKIEIRHPSATADLQYEVELVVALDTGGRDIAPERAAQHIFGYAIGLDMTRRDLQAVFKGNRWPWDMAKNFDDCAPIGVLHRKADVGEIRTGNMTLDVNARRRQTGNIDQMIWSVNEIISEISKLVELNPGDILFTGTPAGVGRVDDRDTLCATIDQLGSIHVTIKKIDRHPG